jgi:hypothetical protein
MDQSMTTDLEGLPPLPDSLRALAELEWRKTQAFVGTPRGGPGRSADGSATISRIARLPASLSAPVTTRDRSAPRRK